MICNLGDPMSLGHPVHRDLTGKSSRTRANRASIKASVLFRMKQLLNTSNFKLYQQHQTIRKNLAHCVFPHSSSIHIYTNIHMYTRVYIHTRTSPHMQSLSRNKLAHCFRVRDEKSNGGVMCACMYVKLHRQLCARAVLSFSLTTCCILRVFSLSF